MKKAILLPLICLSINLFSQEVKETEIKSTISGVTVYLTGAQINRSAEADLTPGKKTLKFVILSPFIDAKSINIKSTGDFTILSVNHFQNYMQQQAKTKNFEELLHQKEEIEKKIDLENTYLTILAEELSFLKRFSVGESDNSNINVLAFKESVSFFSEKVTANRLKQLERSATLKTLASELEKVNSQLKAASEKSDIPTGEIIVTVEAKQNVHAEFSFSYIVKNAGWFPSYDVRVKTIDDPVSLVYRANIHQNTYEDWNNVKLVLSSANPDEETAYQELKPYLLDYNIRPPSYSDNINTVSGYVYDQNTKEPLIGANLNIKGTTIGTIADINGYYKLSVPPSGGTLVCSFIGYRSQEVPISGQTININMVEDAVNLEEVVVMGYGAIQGRARGLETKRSLADESEIMNAPAPSPLIQVEQSRNQTNFEFSIANPYTVPSDGKNLVIDFERYELPTSYEYHATPKISTDAFLIARVIDWEKYNLLEGEANIFFEDTYTGKTLLDLRYMSDTLSLSLGRDKSVIIKRDLQKQLTTKQLLGAKKEETKSWLISVKNNKLQDIDIIIEDQVPVSTREEIEVAELNLSNATKDVESGKLTWKFNLKPSEKKDIELKYSVKYPKNRRLVVE
ncbi:MAG TPA: mucoidy inhibitor MuiA family protein [Bacteroidales bacterium]|nr:mucoidy inhibitor MuiA family protein [Bacteroidales bacterium]